MSTVNNIELKVNLRKNNNEKSDQFGKYYAELERKRTLSLKGLAKHIADHGSIFTRDVIEGVLSKLTQCVPELLSQGVPVKLDGLGTFYPTIENKKNGVSYSELKAGGIDPNEVVKGVHVRFQPEDSELDKITSRKFKEDCSLELTYVVGGESVTRGTGADATTEFVPNLVAYDAWQKLPAENDGHVGS